MGSTLLRKGHVGGTKKKKHRQPFPRRQAEVSAKRSSNAIIRRQIAEDRVLGVTIDQQVDNSVEMERLLM